MRKFIVISIVLLMLAGFAITSSALEVDLVVGRKLLPVGTLTVEVNTAGNLVVTYNITDPEWELLETHLYVGTSPPEKSAPGRFPYDAIDGVYEIDLGADFPEATILYIAAQAEIGKWILVDSGEPIYLEETTWAIGVGDIDEGENFQCIQPCRNWAEYFEFVVP